MAYDLKITGGTIIDGTGAPGISGDVGVKDGKIVALGAAPDVAARTIKADGRVVAPGFVDIHTHYDAQVMWDPLLTVSPWHGVTSVVIGNCGFGIAPTRPEHRELILRTLERVEGMNFDALDAGLGRDWGFTGFGEYLDLIEKRGVGINVGVLLGHTPVRLSVMGEEAVERAATPAEIAAIHDIVVDGLRAGAIGFSSSNSPSHVGFAGKPVPSRLAQTEELRSVAQAMREAGTGIFMMAAGRDPSWDTFEMIVRESGRPLCWTSITSGAVAPGEHRVRLKRAADQIARGLPIYPQTAVRPILLDFDFHQPVGFNTWLFFRPIIEATTDDEKKRIYADPEFRRQLREEVAGRGGNDSYFRGGAGEGLQRRKGWMLQEISWYPPDPSLEARKLADVAAERGIDTADLFLDLALTSNLDARVRLPVSNFIEEDTAEILCDPNVVAGLSDGGAHLSQLCDAGYSTHMLGHWVRDRGIMPIERAIHMMTGRTAEIFGVSDRGRLAEGWAADIVVLDPDTVAAGPLKRVYDLPSGGDRLISPAIGIDAVIVNGTLMPPQGEDWPSATPLAGRLLRNGRARN